ncbi:MAG: hypothetical protein HFJ40_04020 [Clostridia bacterium]|nr:hypothetical protein [Clostridia bacterium]
MKEQRDLKIIKVEDIMINPENPRHNEVQLTITEMGEELIMKQLIRDKETANKMFDLIKSIYESGFIPSLAVILEYRENINKYIPWDGNRRITALKILKNPNVMQNLKYFTYAQINTVFELSKKVQEDFFEVSAYIVKDFKEAAPMIKAIHTTASGAMQWDRIMIKRFEQKLGLKNIITQAQDLLPNVFKDLPNNFPTSTIEKILESKEGKRFLNIDNIDNILTFTSSMNYTEQKLNNIVNDIKSGKINSKTVQSNKKIKEYLNNDKVDEKVKKESKETNKIDTNLNEPTNTVIKNNSKINFIGQNINDMEQIKLSELGVPTVLSPKMNIKKEDTIIFSNINIYNLDNSNERANGIKSLAYELQRSSIKNGYKYYPISYCFLLRALLEQTSIYFLINTNKWKKLVDGKNRDLNLSEIIKYITNNADNLFSDNINIKKIWNIVFDTQTNKNYLDLVIHHPYKIYPNIEYIKTLSDIGLFAIIQYFIDKKREPNNYIK